MDSEYTIREAKRSDLDTLIAFTVQEAQETECTDPDLAAVRLGVDSGLEGSAPVTYWLAQSGGGQVVGAIYGLSGFANSPLRSAIPVGSAESRNSASVCD